MEQKRRQRLSGALGIGMCVIFIPIIIINLILIIRSYKEPEQMPGVLGIKPAVVLSGSMEPTIRTGDLIFIHSTDPARLQKGDVICYLLSGKAVTHRIAEVTAGDDGQPRYVTQGDANNTQDRIAVTAGQVQGIWRGGRIGGAGNFILFMQTTTGMILFIICPLVLLFMWDIWRRYRLDRSEAARTAQLEEELAALKAERDNADRTT